MGAVYKFEISQRHVKTKKKTMEYVCMMSFLVARVRVATIRMVCAQQSNVLVAAYIQQCFAINWKH
jgi:hypothetical protein